MLLAVLSLGIADMCLQFVVFAEREEGDTPYHRQYDFFIQRFASLSLAANNGDDHKYKE